jgi:hypothetical protein
LIDEGPLNCRVRYDFAPSARDSSRMSGSGVKQPFNSLQPLFLSREGGISIGSSGSIG